ncbi:hypothetical protein DIPPA_10183 [Diplonema papillatum]|nr:hypothetical protein DIPPA_10183 [Diplonema papillatum]
MSDASWSALTSALPERSIVRFSRADAPGLTNDSEELLTDITIASMLKAVVVNRFDIVSALLTEDFLLATGFAFSRVYVW